MVAFFCPPPFMKTSRAALPLSYEESNFVGVSSGLASHTFSNVDLKTPSSDRWLVAFLWARRVTAGNGPSLISAEINGQPLDFVVSYVSIARSLFIIGKKLTSGTTGTVVVNWDTSTTESGLKPVIIKGNENLNLVSHNGVVSNSFASRSIPVGVNMGGVLLSGAYIATAQLSASPGLGEFSRDTGGSGNLVWHSFTGKTVADTTATVSSTSAYNIVAATFR